MPLKCIISCCGGVTSKLSLVKIPILNDLQFRDRCKIEYAFLAQNGVAIGS